MQEIVTTRVRSAQLIITTEFLYYFENAPATQVLLEHHLKQLRLLTFLREYDKVARQCAAEGVDYPRYLLRLTEHELLDRERRL